MKKYHAFISYASEDLESFVLPLVKSLELRGLKIWIDKFCLKIGDSITKKVDQGLLESNCGIVILSPNFFDKKFPENELYALFHLENEGKSLILPIWKDISKEDVLKHYPLLVDKFAAKTSEGIDSITDQLQAVLDPDKNEICGKFLLEWTKLMNAASLFLKERPLLNWPRMVYGNDAIGILVTEGYIKKYANEIMGIRNIYEEVYYEKDNYKNLVSIVLIDRLHKITEYIKSNIELKENNLYLD